MNKKIVYLLLLVVTATSCQNNEKTMATYEWTATRSAPKDYPMEIVSGAFIFENGETLYIPKRGVAKNGWGKDGPTHIVGDKMKPVPSKLDITYLSFTENQFYRGTFELPKEEITALFKTNNLGIFNGKEEPFNQLNVGIAPGGLVVLWISGVAAQVEIGRFNATKIDMTMQEFNPSGIQDREVYVNSVLEEELTEGQRSSLTSDGIPFNTWEGYRAKHAWKPTVQLQSGGTVDYIIMEYINGEKETLIADLLKDTKLKERAIPRYVTFYWYDAANNKFGTRINFNDQETVTTFQNMLKKSTRPEMTLLFTVDTYNSDIEIALLDDENKTVINEASIKVFDTSD